MTTIFQFNALTGNFDLVTNSLTPSEIVGGNPNQFSYFDSTGALASLPNWNVDIASTPNRYGLRYFTTIDPVGLAAYSVTNQIAAATVPSADAPNDSEVPLQIGFDLDPTNTGFGLGSAGLALRLLDIYATARTSSTNGAVAGLNVNMNMGDAVITGGSVSGLTGVDVFVGSDQGFSTGNVKGLNINSNFVAGSTLTGGAQMVTNNLQVLGDVTGGGISMYSAFGNFTPTNPFSGGMAIFQANMGIAGSLGNGQGFVDNTQFQSGSSVSGDWNSASLGPNFQAGSAVRSYTGVTINPQFNAPITDDIRGNGVFFNSPTAGTNITGYEVNFNNATASGGISGINININNSIDANPQGVYGLQSNSRVGINATTTMASGQGFQVGNRIEHAYSVAPGSPVTGTDSLGNNFAGDLIAQDDIAVGGFGIGWNSVGFVASVGVAATKTVDKATVFLPAMSLPDPGYTTGGTIDDLAFVRLYPPLAQGGTAVITDLYGLKIDSLFGDFATAGSNVWGLYLDTSAPNYLGRGDLQLGGATSGLLTLRAAAVTTSHALTMPGAQGAASTVLTNDGAGNLSWAAAGSSSPTTFTLANNQTSFSDITGFYVDPSLHSGFTAEATVNRYHAAAAPYLSDQEDTAFYGNTGTALDNNGTVTLELSTSKILVGSSGATFNGNIATSLVQLNADGTEDAAFTANLGTGFNNPVIAIAEQADGSILVGGSFTVFNASLRKRLVRLNADGTEDATFYGNLGTAFDGPINSIAVQADQKLVLVGNFTDLNGNTRNNIVRLNTDGTEDTTFYTNISPGLDSSGSVVSVLASQDIIIGGQFSNVAGSSRSSIARIDSTGTLQTSIGAFDNAVYTLKEQPADNYLLVGGQFTTYNGNSRNGLVRLTDTFTEDTAFYTNLGTGFAGPDIVASVAMQGTQIIAVGGFTSLNGNTRNQIVRLNADGTEDTAFYTSVGTAFNAYVASAYVQANQQLLITGNFTTFDGNTRNRIIRYEILVTPSPTELVAQSTIKGIYKQLSGAWMISIGDSVGDNTGTALQMTDLGQMQYTTTNISGTLVTSEIVFQIEAL